MKLIKRLQLAFKYNFDSEFIVIPLENNMQACRFLEYKDAYKYAHQQAPAYLPYQVFVAVTPNNVKDSL